MLAKMCPDRPCPNYHSCKRNTVLQNIERDQVQNRLMQSTMESAARKMARLQDQVRLFVAQDENEVSSSGFQSKGEPVNKVSFSGVDHPEERDLVRPGTPAVLQAILDNDSVDPGVLYPASSRPTPDQSQSPPHFVRELLPSEVWEEADMPRWPIVFSPVPRRPLRSVAHLLMNYVEQAVSDDELFVSPLSDADLSDFSEDIVGRRMGKMVDELVACYYREG